MSGLGALLSACAALVLGDLVPLALLLDGRLESADVLMGLAIQVGLLGGFTRRSPRGSHLHWGDRILLVLLPVFLGILIASRVSWDLVSAAGVTVTAVSTFGALWLASRQSGHTISDLAGGTWALACRLGLVWVGILGLDVADRLERLSGSGWEPATLEEGSSDLGVRLVQLVLDLGIPTVALPALMVLSLQTLNDVLLLVRQSLPEPPDVPEPGVADPAVLRDPA